MRITQSMLSNNMLRHLFDSQAKMDKYLTQTYTGKKINRPSDDPVVAMKGIDYRTEVKEVEQYRRNATEVWTWFDNTDEALDKATQVMHRMEELAVQAANDTLTENERNSIKTEVEQLKAQMIEIANTNVNGKYIFNGTDMDTPALKKLPILDADGNVIVDKEGELAEGFSVEDGNQVEDENGNVILDENGKINYENFTSGEVNSFKIEVSKGILVDANLSPEGVFDQGLIDNIDNFIAALDGEGDTDLNESIKDLNDSTLNLVNARADIGARMNRLELVESRLEAQEIIAKEMMSNNENIDFEEAVTNLITQETLHRAALSAGSRIIQPTLMDFLR